MMVAKRSFQGKKEGHKVDLLPRGPKDMQNAEFTISSSVPDPGSFLKLTNLRIGPDFNRELKLSSEPHSKAPFCGELSVEFL